MDIVIVVSRVLLVGILPTNGKSRERIGNFLSSLECKIEIFIVEEKMKKDQMSNTPKVDLEIVVPFFSKFK